MQFSRHKVITAFVLGVFLLVGCAQHAIQIRDAQDSFSHGANLELARKFNFHLPGIENPTEEAQRHYAIALGLVNEAINDSTSDLKRDSLYGVALTIKALASWRLGDTATAQKVAKQVTDISDPNAEKNRVWPRDRGVCKALNELVKIDMLAKRAKVFEYTKDSSKQEATLAGILRDGEQVHFNIMKLGKDADLEGHPFQVYIAQTHCELAYILYVATAAAVHFNANKEAGKQKSYKQRYNDVRDNALEHLAAVSNQHGLKTLKKKMGTMHRYYSALMPSLD